MASNLLQRTKGFAMRYRPFSRQYNARTEETMNSQQDILPESNLRQLYSGRFGRCGRGRDFWRK